jgi:hypothetical protein
MLPDFIRQVRRVWVVGLALSVFSVGSASAQEPEHVVSPAELQQALVSQAQGREENLEKVQSFFSSEPVQAAFGAARLDATKVEEAVGFLKEEELARLAAKTAALQADFAAGALTNQQLTYIVIAIAAAVIVLIAT